MTPDSAPSRPREIPHSRRPFAALVGVETLNAGLFNAGEVSMSFNIDENEHYVYIEEPSIWEKYSVSIIVASEIVRKGAVYFYRWRLGKIPGPARGERGTDVEIEDFDGQVEKILQSGEVPYNELRQRLIDLLPEERRGWVSNSDPTVLP